MHVPGFPEPRFLADLVLDAMQALVEELEHPTTDFAHHVIMVHAVMGVLEEGVAFPKVMAQHQARVRQMLQGAIQGRAADGLALLLQVRKLLSEHSFPDSIYK